MRQIDIQHVDCDQNKYKDIIMGNNAGCCFGKGNQTDNILQQQIKDRNGAYRVSTMVPPGGTGKFVGSKQAATSLYKEDFGLGDETSLPIDTKYLKITVEKAFLDAGQDDIGGAFIGLLDNDQMLSFNVLVQNLRLQGFPANDQIFMTCHIGEDYIERAVDDASDDRLSQRKLQSQYKQGSSADRESQIGIAKGRQTKQGGQRGGPQGGKVSRTDPEYVDNKTKWQTSNVTLDNEGTAFIDDENHFKYDSTFEHLQNQYFVMEFFSLQNTKRPFSVLMIEFMALAIGPKHCDFEVKDLKHAKSFGRVQFDVNIQQLETMDITLDELLVKLNGKEERPLYGQFKVITNKELPKISDSTKTQVGRFKKEKNETKLKWHYGMSQAQQNLQLRTSLDLSGKLTDASVENLSVKQEISLETLKNSTIQFLLKVDMNFSEQMTEKVLKRIKTKKNFQYVENSKTGTEKEGGEGGNSKQGGARYMEVPSNRQDEQKHKEKEDGGDFQFNQDDDDDEQSPNRKSQQKRGGAAASTEIGGAGAVNEIEIQFSEGNTINSARRSEYDKKSMILLDHQQKMSEGALEIDIEQNEKNQRSRTMYNKMNERRSMSLPHDGRDYYQKYGDDDESGTRDSKSLYFNDNLVGECYVGFSKLLQSELRKYEKRDSCILSSRMSRMSNRQSHAYQSSSKTSIRQKSVFGGQRGLPQNPDHSVNHPQHQHGAAHLSPRAAQGNMEKKTFEEQIWIMGKVLGTVRGTFILANMPVMQQMTLGVLTENGISMNVSPISAALDQAHFMSGLLKKGRKDNEKITQLIELTNKLKKLDTINSKGSTNKKMEYSKYNEKLNILNNIIDLLIEDDKGMDGHVFKYNDELDLMRAQYTMIDLAFHCLLFVENVKYELRKEYYEILSQIFMRDELRLSNMALGQVMEEVEEKIEALKSSQDSTTQASTQKKGGQDDQVVQELAYLEKVKAEKIKIASFYQKLLYQTLDDCLNKFCRKDVEPYLRSYLEICISVAFFRVPKFQSIFLECIRGGGLETGGGQVQIKDEWRNIDWDLDEDEDDHAQARDSGFGGLFKIFDWELQFFKHIPRNNATAKDYDDSIRLMRKIETNKKWQARVKKRSIAYFQIIKRWAELLKNTVQTYSIMWQDIPGYRNIVKSVLQELKHRNITEYPDTLIDATTALIENPQLLTVVTNIVFLRTNAYDSMSLSNTMGHVTKWMNHIESLGLSFPSNFDFSFFLQGIKIALEMEHSVSTPRTIHLLFKTMHFFPLEARSKIITELLNPKYFYSLLFSWSYNIRDLFIALLLYQFEYLYIIKTTELLGLSASDLSTTNPQGEPLPSQGSEQPEITNPGESNGVKVGNISSARQNRLENLAKLNTAISQVEQQIAANPTMAEKELDKSMSSKKMRITQDLSQKQGGGGGAGILQKMVLKKQAPRHHEEEEELKGLGMEFAQGAKQEQKHRKLGNSGTMSQFIKTYRLFKKALSEIEILDEYYSLTSTSRPINDSQSSNNSLPPKTSIDLGSETSVQTFANLETQAKKIIAKVPPNIRIYIAQGIADFYKQVEEYETWKAQTVPYYAGQLHSETIFYWQILPEFSMEKNMPVEDDDNLEKKEEW